MAGLVVYFEIEFQEGAAEALHFDPFGGFGEGDIGVVEIPNLGDFALMAARSFWRSWL